LLASRIGDDNKVNNYRWQSDDINSSNNNKNSITARSYGVKSGHKQIKTFTADGSSSVIYDLDKLLTPMNLTKPQLTHSSIYVHTSYIEILHSGKYPGQ
jgi:hypothetical protein